MHLTARFFREAFVLLACLPPAVAFGQRRLDADRADFPRDAIRELLLRPPTFFQPLGLNEKQPENARNATAATLIDRVGEDVTRKEEKPVRVDPLAQARQERAVAMEARAAQYAQRLRSALWAELNFIRQVCDLSADQRPAIKAAGEAALQQVAREIADPELPGWAGSRSLLRGPHVIRERLTLTLQKTLSAEQFARFSEETAQRTAHRKQAAISSAVARLDDLLALTQDQRMKIMDLLRLNWQDDWEWWLALSRYRSDYCSQIPEQYLVPLLDDDQKYLWQCARKISATPLPAAEAPDEDWWKGNKP